MTTDELVGGAEGGAAPVTVYSVVPCPYCDMARELLTSREVPFREVKVDRSDADTRARLKAKSGMMTFPQIFCGDEVIGGYDQLSERDAKDRLASLRAARG